MYKIIMQDLEVTVARINRIMGIAEPKWNNPGTYVLDGAYGGWKLARIENVHGGQSDITDGYVSKRELYNLMHAYIRGLEDRSRAEQTVSHWEQVK